MAEFFAVIAGNPILNVGFIAWASAQLLKTVLYWMVTRRFRAERMLGAGGMPSSHTALVTSLCAAMARVEGFGSPLFALSLIFACIVVYDALGVRRAAGEQAKVLNQIRFDFKDMNNFFLSIVNASAQDADGRTEGGSANHRPLSDGEKLLKEFLGHTPIEVLAGAALGILVGAAYPL